MLPHVPQWPSKSRGFTAALWLRLEDPNILKSPNASTSPVATLLRYRMEIANLLSRMVASAFVGLGQKKPSMFGNETLLTVREVKADLTILESFCLMPCDFFGVDFFVQFSLTTMQGAGFEIVLVDNQIAIQVRNRPLSPAPLCARTVSRNV